MFACTAYLNKEFAQRGINMVFCDYGVPGSLNFQTDKTGKTYLVAYSGIIVGPGGDVYYGKFPEPIYIDMLDNPGHNYLIRECFRRDFPLVTPESSKILSKDKDQSRRVMLDLGINISPGKRFSLQNIDQLAASVNEFKTLDYSHGVVIKPADGSGGKGVSLFPAETDIAEIRKKAIETMKKHGAILVEPWIESLAIHDDDGTRLDWNIRALASPKGIFGLEARVGEWGEPVNKSPKARIWGAGKIYQKLREAGLSEEQINDFVQEMEAVSIKIAKYYRTNYLGMDFILDKNGKLRVIETNTGNVGGIYSLSDLGIDKESSMLFAHNFVNMLDIKKRPKPKPEDIEQSEEIINDREKGLESFLRDLETMADRFRDYQFVGSAKDIYLEFFRLLKQEAHKLQEHDKETISAYFIKLTYQLMNKKYPREAKEALDLARKFDPLIVDTYIFSLTSAALEAYDGNLAKAFTMFRELPKHPEWKYYQLEHYDTETQINIYIAGIAEILCFQNQLDRAAEIRDLLKEEGHDVHAELVDMLIQAEQGKILTTPEDNEHLKEHDQRTLLLRTLQHRSYINRLDSGNHSKDLIGRLSKKFWSKVDDYQEKLDNRTKQKQFDKTYRDIAKTGSPRRYGIDPRSAGRIRQRADQHQFLRQRT